MNIILSEYQKSEAGKFNAISKARNDAIKICQNNGFELIKLYEPGKSRLTTIFQIIKGCLISSIKAGKREIILVQYPHNFLADRFILKFLAVLRSVKKFKLCVLIHDIDSMRPIGSEVSDINIEMKLFKNTDMIICHTKAMKALFSKCLADCVCEELGPFYYLSSKPFFRREYQENKRIAIAGNLTKRKAGYIYDIPVTEGVTYHLYGVGVEENDLPQNVAYYGKFEPDALVDRIEGEYGLVWDGESANTCTGQFGEYLKLNSPHKFSLYIAACMPVIVWKESALSEFVEHYKIGLCISTLNDIQDIKVTKNDYDEMTQNLSKVRDQIVKGENLIRIMDKLNVDD